MGSDHAAYGRVADLVQVAFPDMTAVLNIFLQQRVGDSAIAQENRPTKVNTAGLVNFLNEQIVSHFRAPGLAQQVDLAVNDGKHGLDIQDPAGESGCLGDASAPLEIFQRIYQRHNNDFLLLRLQSLGNLLCGHSPVQKPERKLHQNACTHGCACAIHDIDVFVIRRRDHGALICAGKLGRKGNDNSGLPRLPRPFILLRKGARGRLTGGGQHIAFN